jgi:ubiquitin-protein ligase E3 B
MLGAISLPQEFLEMTLRAGFDPDFGLFLRTADGKLYPSPASHVHEDHLQLFEYLGQMLGKMLYDGIVVDLPLAHFFLNALLGRHNTVDELRSLDADLARNMTFVKEYDGEVEDLGLVFAIDEDQLGQRVTVPLRPGGTAVDVTNENRILYVHLVADFRLNKQLKPQTEAIKRGFYRLVKPAWLAPFNAPELQRLISGDDVPLDVEDLRRHSNYEAGLHSSHRVIKWLFEVLAKDFTRAEQEAFLKFVTSCSRPPVLGFASLQPRFTIRGVSEGQSEDSYTLGTVVLNMFSSGHDTDRLPTSSTCFNTLK